VANKTKKPEFDVNQEYIQNLCLDQSRLEQDVQMRAEFWQRSLGQLRRVHRAAEKRPSVAGPRASWI
jgi:hypothetical protein